MEPDVDLDTKAAQCESTLQAAESREVCGDKTGDGASFEVEAQ